MIGTSKAGLTQQQLAEKVGTTAETIDRIEMNDFDDFPISLLQKVARVMGRRLEAKIVETKVVARPEEKNQPAA